MRESISLDAIRPNSDFDFAPPAKSSTGGHAMVALVADRTLGDFARRRAWRSLV
jgi:hypothetical protein